MPYPKILTLIGKKSYRHWHSWGNKILIMEIAPTYTNGIEIWCQQIHWLSVIIVVTVKTSLSTLPVGFEMAFECVFYLDLLCVRPVDIWDIFVFVSLYQKYLYALNTWNIRTKNENSITNTYFPHFVSRHEDKITKMQEKLWSTNSQHKILE